MPVSATEKRDRLLVREVSGGHTDLAALGELERVRDEVAEDLRHLRFVGVQRRNLLGLLEDERHRLAHQQRPQHAAQRAEQVADVELDRADDDLARLDLGEVEQVVHQLAERVGRLADEGHLPLLLGGEVAVGALRAAGAPSAWIEFTGVRNSWLMLERKRVLSSSARRR